MAMGEVCMRYMIATNPLPVTSRKTGRRQWDMDVRSCQMNLIWMRITLSRNYTEARVPWVTLGSSKPRLGQWQGDQCSAKGNSQRCLLNHGQAKKRPGSRELDQQQIIWPKGNFAAYKESQWAPKNLFPWCHFQDARPNCDDLFHL